MGYSAGGAEGCGRCICVEVRLGGEVGSRSQVGVHSAVAGAAVREGVWSLRHRGSDVGLLSTVTSSAVRSHVLLSLRRKSSRGTALGEGEGGRTEGEAGVTTDASLQKQRA